MRGIGLVLVVLGGVALAAWRGEDGSSAPAKERGELPSSCSSGELVVASGGGEFDCVSVREALRMSSCSSGELVVASSGGELDCVSVRDALHMSGCSSGEFVVAGSSGELDCVSPSSTSWGVRALLPECESGQTLLSEGFGRWKCVEPAALRER